ncbi:YIP1 family protein [Formosa sp. 3Alg 14/1]
MKSLLLTLISTNKGLNVFDEEFEDDLYRKSLLIFGVYGIVKFIFDFNEQTNEKGFFINLFEFAMSILFSIIIGHIFSYILYKVGNWIKGKSNYIEIFSLLAYSYFPFIIGLIIIGILKKTEHEIGSLININLRIFILYLSWFFSIKILYQGLMKFNKYGMKKAIFNLSILIGFIIGLYFLLPNLIIE